MSYLLMTIILTD